MHHLGGCYSGDIYLDWQALWESFPATQQKILLKFWIRFLWLYQSGEDTGLQFFSRYLYSQKNLDPRSRICVAFQKKLASTGCMLSCLDSALTVGQWMEVAQKDSEAGSRRSRSQNFLQKGIKRVELRKGSSFSWPASCLPQWQKRE